MCHVTRKAIAGAAAGLITLALTLSLLLFILAIKPFTVGIWFQSEGPIGMMHVLSGVCGIGIAIWGIADKKILYQVCHPFVFVPLVLAIWSFFAGLFHPITWMGIFGAPETGEGVLWFLDFAVMTASTILIVKLRIPRLILFSVAIIVVAVISGLTWAYENPSPFVPVPYFFPDYLAFLGGFIVMAVAGFSPNKKYRKVIMALAILVGGTAIFISQNWAAIGIATVAIPVLLLVYSRLHLLETNIRLLGAGVVIFFSIAVTLTLFMPYLPELATQPNFVGKLANSILSRARLVDILVTAIFQDPLRLFVGWGWGSYSSLFAINLPVEWAILREGAKIADEVVGKHWDAVLRVDFHSHNFMIEAISGGGIPAMLMAWAIFAMVPLWSRRRLLPLTIVMTVYTAGVSAFWFMMPICLPFMALAWGAVARPVQWHIPRLKLWGILAVSATLGIYILYMGLGSLAFSRSAYYFQPSMPPPLMIGKNRQPCTGTFDDWGRGGLHLAHRLRVMTSSIVNDLNEENDISDLKASFLRGIFCAAEDYIEKGASFRLLTSSILARADLAFAPKQNKIQPLIDGILGNWGGRLEKTLAMAPKRTDLAASYLLWLLKENRNQEFSRWASLIFNRNPDDPIGLWFSGIAKLEYPDGNQEGIKRMRHALELGVERMVPVDDEVKAQILR